MAETGRARLVLVGAAVVAVVGAGLVAWSATAESSADEYVTRSGTSLRVGDDAFRFVGFNLYDAAASDSYSCSPATRLDDDGLDEAMDTVRDAGGTVVRFWAYQTYTDGGLDFSGTDRVIAAARSHGLRVLPVLEDGPGDCSTGKSGEPLSSVNDGTWYVDGYREPLGSAAVSYREYVATIARHYRDEPAIVAWSLVNEAETAMRDAGGASVLVDFARDVSAVVHRVDPHHLVTLGTQANGAPGASGSDFREVYALPGLDLTEVHDWGDHGSDEEAMPGATRDGALPNPAECQATDASIACSFALARSLGKPIVVGEAGIAAEDDSERATRATLFEAKVDAAFEAGAAGYLVWQLNTANTDGYGVLVAGDDPLLRVLRTAAEEWASGS
ncbi:cellulase family glycosylhydrolase [Nocardioides anomalus]|uniref:mannan endo-1,4-beta-mannosidase n=1 Tax=Nocardioides anomalus TaxID=2712223 RepID=A0A6G6WDP2_9ACTN|nr:cellulase family glycosylhydrolase [Nocardioides anomalus]QIG43362.1 cellulase family glycosylhydrolase [Nocardioides anomalus]